VALLIGVKAKGIVGVFFAIPVAVVLLTLIEEIQSLSNHRSASSEQEKNETAKPSESSLAQDHH
jgi:predicted PurR-regulated permease PerM